MGFHQSLGNRAAESCSSEPFFPRANQQLEVPTTGMPIGLAERDEWRRPVEQASSAGVVTGGKRAPPSPGLKSFLFDVVQHVLFEESASRAGGRDRIGGNLILAQDTFGGWHDPIGGLSGGGLSGGGRIGDRRG